VEHHIDLQVGSLELLALFQVDKILGIGEGTVEGTGDTDSLLLDYNHLDSLHDRG